MKKIQDNIEGAIVNEFHKEAGRIEKEVEQSGTA